MIGVIHFYIFRNPGHTSGGIATTSIDTTVSTRFAACDLI
jgi:hypothetical protein